MVSIQWGVDNWGTLRAESSILFTLESHLYNAFRVVLWISDPSRPSHIDESPTYGVSLYIAMWKWLLGAMHNLLVNILDYQSCTFTGADNLNESGSISIQVHLLSTANVKFGWQGGPTSDAARALISAICWSSWEKCKAQTCWKSCEMTCWNRSTTRGLGGGGPCCWQTML